ncbi:MAG: glycosyltransferase [Ruminococcaceae bacterium]|nr:glycosyltransferase [Oscillospiraceae bacterium]
MKVVFFSNYLTHHQSPFCRELQKIDNVDFTFVALEPIEQERLDMGFEDMNMYPYVLRAYESDQIYQKAVELLKECDIMLCGNISDSLLIERVKTGKPMFVLSERMFKKGLYQRFSPRTFKRMKNTHSSFKNSPTYLLCASAFTSADFARLGAYKNKAYKWGYFPEVKRYDNINTLIDKKTPASILWVGRMIDWKHPEFAIEVAKRLKEEGYKFTLDIIGNGKKEEQIRQMVNKNELNDCVKLHGSMSPEEVREYMEKTQIFLFTSDRHEGWGAVLNESMNSGCATVSSHIIGSVPFMVQHSENGLIYKSGNVNDLYKKVKFLLNSPDRRYVIGVNAYKTLAEQWNPENAAKRFYALAQAILKGQDTPALYSDGVCSEAEFLKDGYHHI